MNRPPVSVVMPFAGDQAAAREAQHALLALDTEPDDEVILVDNSPGAVAQAAPAIDVIRASSEHSPAYARNVGATRAQRDWILFMDADCRPKSGVLAAYFAEPIADDVGALAGEVRPATPSASLAERYGAARSFLGQQAHLEHPFRPRAVAANLLVRRIAFDQVGGFYEHVLAAEDTDFSWRLQQAGWRLELRPGAIVEHRYRISLSGLRRQWRGYAAGRAWLARRYDGFEPEPAVRRGLQRIWRRARRRQPVPRRAAATHAGRLDRGRYLALDALLSLEELAGLTLSNRPRRPRLGAARVVLIAERFPTQGDPLVELARALDGARIEALARPQALDLGTARELEIDYREDDGIATRVGAVFALAVRHPLRCALDLLRRTRAEPKLSALAPAVRRLERDRDARLLPLGGETARATAGRIARLAGRRVEERVADPRR